MKEKFKFMFILVILLFLVIGAVSASDTNTTDIISQNQENEQVTISNPLEDDLNTGNYTDNDYLSSNDDDSMLSLESNDEQNTYGSSAKSNLQIVNNTNFVKKGDTLYLYLADSTGKKIPDKQLTIEFNGKTYQTTTTNYGKFGIVVDSSSPSASMKISFKGDDQYNAFSQIFNFYIDTSVSITIGNSKLLTNGYLRIYLRGSTKYIANKTITIKIGDKKFTKVTNDEGFVVFKPSVSPDTYNVIVTYGDYTISKTIKCIKGDVKNPLKEYIPTVNGVPDIDVMPGNYVMADDDGQYSLLKAQYQEVMKRDSYCLYLYGKLSKYTFFKTKTYPNINHIIKREKWNAIEKAINTKIVKQNQKNYWPSVITVYLKGKSYTYSEVRDFQNTKYTCGPTSASVCSQALRNFYSEKYFQIKAHVTNGVNIPVLKRAIENTGFKTYYFYSSTFSTALKELQKGGAALIAYLPGHYVSIIDVSKDGKKVLVSNSYGSYDVGSGKVPTGWVSVKYFKTKFANIGLVVKLNYKLSSTVKKQTDNFYKSMGTNWMRQNTNERIPDIGV